MKKVLVIYELMPEDTLFYILEEEGQDLQDTLNAHTQVVNVDDEDGYASKLNYKLEGKTPLKVEKGRPINIKELNVDYVVWSGFYQ